MSDVFDSTDIVSRRLIISIAVGQMEYIMIHNGACRKLPASFDSPSHRDFSEIRAETRYGYRRIIRYRHLAK